MQCVHRYNWQPRQPNQTPDEEWEKMTHAEMHTHHVTHRHTAIVVNWRKQNICIPFAVENPKWNDIPLGPHRQCRCDIDAWWTMTTNHIAHKSQLISMSTQSPITRTIIYFFVFHQYDLMIHNNLIKRSIVDWRHTAITTTYTPYGRRNVKKSFVVSLNRANSRAQSTNHQYICN